MLPTAHLQNLGQALSDAVLSHRANTALIEVERYHANRVVTYDGLEKEARAVAAVLYRQGVRPGDRVAILLTNQSRWLTAATGVFWLGATLVPVDYKATPADQAGILAHAEPKAIVSEWSVWKPLAQELDTQLDTQLDTDAALLLAHVPDQVSADLVPPASRWADAVDTMSAELQQNTPALDDVREHLRTVLDTIGREDTACIVYSSGTGGQVKGCMLTHGNYLAQAEALGGLYPMKPSERFFSILPTNHAIDFMTGFVMPFCFGATVVHQRSLRPEFLRFTLKRYGITHMAVVPRLLTAFEERITERVAEQSPGRRALTDGIVRLNELLTLKKPNHALSSRLLKPLHDGFGGKLRYVFAGGAFVDPKLAQFFYDRGLPVVIGYGLTEAGTVLTVNDLKPFRPDTVGPPVPGVTLEIRDAGPDGVGEVWVTGPTVMKGYFKNDALTAETIVDGWLRTGDMGLVDAAGHLKLLGRARNMIVTDGGKNVYPEDIESTFEGTPGVEELCVFAADYIWPRGSMTDEQLIVVVRPVEGDAALPEDEWRAALAARNRALTDYKRLSGFVLYTPEFPRTASLKVKRLALAQALRDTLDRDSITPFDRDSITPFDRDSITPFTSAPSGTKEDA